MEGEVEVHNGNREPREEKESHQNRKWTERPRIRRSFLTVGPPTLRGRKVRAHHVVFV